MDRHADADVPPGTLGSGPGAAASWRWPGAAPGRWRLRLPVTTASPEACAQEQRQHRPVGHAEVPDRRGRLRQTSSPVVCLEAADNTLGDKIHDYANLLAASRGFTVPAADLTTTLNAAQTLANSLEILGDARADAGQLQPGAQHLQRQRRHHRSCRATSARWPDSLGTAKGASELRYSGPRPRPRRRCRGGRPGAPWPGPAPPPARQRGLGAGEHRSAAASVPHDADAATAPPPTSWRPAPRPRRGRRGVCGASGNSAVRAGWWMRSSVASGTSDVGVGQSGHEQAHAAEVEDGVGPRQRLGQHAARLGGGQVALGDDDDEGQLLAEREGGVHRSALHHGGGDQSAEHAGRCVLGMPVVGARHRERVSWHRPPRRPRRRARRKSPARGRRGSASAPSPRSGRVRAPRRPPGPPGARRRRRGPNPRPRCARGETVPPRPRRSRNDREPRPTCRNRARGWPTMQGPGRARVRLGGHDRCAGEASGEGCPARVRTGTATCCVPSVTTTVPTVRAPAAADRRCGVPARTPAWR